MRQANLPSSQEIPQTYPLVVKVLRKHPILSQFQKGIKYYRFLFLNTPLWYTQTRMNEIRESGWQGPKVEALGARVVNGVNDAVLGWWEHVGPKRVEDKWVQAHQRILDSIPDDDQRKEAFKVSAEKWRRIGGALGATATAVDFSLAGVGLWLSTRNPEQIAYWFFNRGDTLLDSIDTMGMRFNKHPKLWRRYRDWYENFFQTNDSLYKIGGNNSLFLADANVKERRRKIAGRLFSFIPGGAAIATYAGMGPAHAVAKLSARAVEGVAIRSLKKQAVKPK